MDNKNFIKVYDNVIPHSLCDEIVEKFESNKLLQESPFPFDKLKPKPKFDRFTLAAEVGFPFTF